MRDTIKGLTKIQKYYIHQLALIHQVGDLIIEGDQITKTGNIAEALMDLHYGILTYLVAILLS